MPDLGYELISLLFGYAIICGLWLDVSLFGELLVDLCVRMVRRQLDRPLDFVDILNEFDMSVWLFKVDHVQVLLHPFYFLALNLAAQVDEGDALDLSMPHRFLLIGFGICPFLLHEHGLP